MSYQKLEEQIHAWAAAQPTVRALVVIGSRARTEPAADAWSDLDLYLFVTDSHLFTQNEAWLERFGRIWLKALQMTGAGYPEWLLLYEGGYKVDFLLVPAVGAIAEILYGPVFGKVSRRGLRILIDKAGAEPASIVENSDRAPLSESAELETAVQLFLISAFRAAGFLRRGDLWRARRTMDGDLRQRLEQMLAWHAQALGEDEIDTWFDGRFIEQWADPRATAVLPRLFPPYEQAAMAGAMRELIDLYVRLAEETTERRHVPYLETSIPEVTSWIEATLKEII